MPAVCIPEGADAAWTARLRARLPGGARVIAAASPAAGAAAAGREDVAFVLPGCEVADGWLDALARAARADDLAATVHALALHRAGVVADPGTRARLPPTASPCLLARRAALDLVELPQDTDWTAALMDFQRAASERGLLHVAAGGVAVGWNRPLQADPPPAGEEDEPDHAPRDRVCTYARSTLDGPTLTIDALCLGPRQSGTQVHVLELLTAVARTGAWRVRALVPDELGAYASDALDRAAVELLPVRALRDGINGEAELPAPSDVAHRPYQLSSAEDALLLRYVGRRQVLSLLDLILYRTAGYHASRHDWGAYRRLTRASLAAADMVVVSSRHEAEDALADDLVPADRLVVAPPGTDATGLAAAPVAVELPVRAFLLVLGNDFEHKNRVFALRLLNALRTRGWDGGLVLAGGRVAHGSSRERERGEARDGVTELDAVSDGQRRWLYEHAAAVLYPSFHEGFGLVPFEAAAAGTPCLYAAVTAMAETVEGIDAPLVPWDPEASADRCLVLLRSRAAAAAHVAALRERAARYTWDGHARDLLAVYDAALRAPPRTQEELAADILAAEAERGRWEGTYWHLVNAAGPAGMALVGPDGTLPEESRRALAALSARPATARPLNALLRLARRAPSS